MRQVGNPGGHLVNAIWTGRGGSGESEDWPPVVGRKGVGQWGAEHIACISCKLTHARYSCESEASFVSSIARLNAAQQDALQVRLFHAELSATSECWGKECWNVHTEGWRVPLQGGVCCVHTCESRYDTFARRWCGHSGP